MIVSNQQRNLCYQLADTHVLGRQLVSDKQRRGIADETIRAFELQMERDPDQFTKGDRQSIVKSIKKGQEIKGFILSTILMTVIGWMVGKMLDSLWDWWKTRGRSEQLS